MSTPVRDQYLAIKKRYPDTIVFFRLGDFYETFDDDARLVAQACDIVLTSRPVGKDQRVPLAGVPYHAVDSYLAKLINAGFRVAIVEQMEDPATAKGLVDRQVVRVVTRGTVTEPALLDERRNNYLAALAVGDRRVGVAYADVTTGEFRVTQIPAEDVEATARQEIERLQAAEVLVSAEGCRDSETSERWSALLRGAHVTVYERWRFDPQTAREALLTHFGVRTLAGFGCEGLPQAVQAAGALLQYLQDTQRGRLAQLQSLSTYSTDGFMALDTATRRNLELVVGSRTGSVKGSLLAELDITRTPMGGRRLRSWLMQPLIHREEIEARLDAVEAIHNATGVREKLRQAMGGVGDLERLTNRLLQGIATPRDLLGLRAALLSVPGLRALVAELVDGAGKPEAVAQVLGQMHDCAGESARIGEAIDEDAGALLTNGGVIRRGYSAELDEIDVASRDAKTWVANLERTERERTGIRSLKVGFNKVFGYYIEVSASNQGNVPADYQRKQTLVNGERFVTPELKEYEALILTAQERRIELETTLFRELCTQLAAGAGRMLATARALAELDAWASLAEAAIRNRYVRPQVADDDLIEIEGGRHPVVERLQREEPFVPNDTLLSPEAGDIVVLTGPNMAGKSTYLRQVALIVLMAQIGSFVPAERAHVGIVDRIFTRIGAQDEITAGQSTFMVEMVEVANILHHATSKSLLVLDEVGRGTSTYDGISIAWAVVEYIHNHPRLRAKTLFATHYHELTELGKALPRVRNYNMAVAEEGDHVVFLRRVVPGGADRSYGIHVAMLAGLPRTVISRAQEILQQLEKEAARAPGMPRAPRVVRQLAFTAAENPVVEELRGLDVSGMTPLEAIAKLYELQRKAGEDAE